jgi:hypothetical protein
LSTARLIVDFINSIEPKADMSVPSRDPTSCQCRPDKVATDGETLYYRAKTRDCRSCLLKAHCCPKVPLRRIQRSIYEEARDVARALAKTEAFDRSRRDRKRVEMLFAHLKRIFRLGRLRLRGPCGAQFEFTMAAIAQNLRRLAKLLVRPPPVTEVCFA